MPTAIVPPEGFETKIKQLSPQLIKLKQNNNEVRNSFLGVSIAPRKMHVWPIEDSRYRDYGGGNECSQATGVGDGQSDLGRAKLSETLWLPEALFLEGIASG